MACGMHFVPLNCAMVRINTRKGHIVAEIISSLDAEKAPAAGDTGFNSNSISCEIEC